MRVREWRDIVEDVVDSDVDPEGWRAVAGTRAHGIGEDLYLGHADAGMYHLKTYAKNPFEVKGVGTQVARNLDDEIGSYLPQKTGGRFAVQPVPRDEQDAETKANRLEETIKAHADAPTTPGDLFDDMMEVLESPAYGPMEFDLDDRSEDLDELSTTFEDAEEVLEMEFEDLLEDDEIGRGFF